ncbi:MAG TPA: hypothetical protein VE646_14310, partial [Actinomycetota bacterium]|nr:hypothetical protein [Actinomycetota bacterium]
MELAHLDVLRDRNWPFDRWFRALGYTFRVRSDLDGAQGVLSRLLAPFLDRDEPEQVPTYTLTRRLSPGSIQDTSRFRYELFLDGSSIQRVSSPGSMLDWLITDFCRRAVESTEEYVA